YYNAVLYGVFAAVNKSFGSYGSSVVKNASLRILEYAVKCGWSVPPKSKDPLKALREFFDHFAALGYAESVTFTRKGEDVVCEVKGLRQWNSVAELRDLHYPTLPIFLVELVTAFLDQFFKMTVAAEPLQVDEEKRSLSFKFSYRSKFESVAPLAIPESRPLELDE
ncbi:MAG TPA: hypothetical protein VM889_10905, partial [Candidatus Thermoplasmatota archaeon]|nr:hypothetical protein [Candidatus Thermoplasmatota archaeon]